MTTDVRCHYEVLGVERDADAATIKKAHRKLALKLHPDKNVEHDDQDVVHQQFLAVQQAYECLSDAQERKWYDEHREAILQGWTAHGDNENVDILFDVVPYMHPGCFNGFEDSNPGGFYAVYRTVFQEILKGEMSGDGSLEYLETPVFGNSQSTWDEVAAFYQAWESFASSLSYAWADQWDLQEAEHRQVRRAMEDENKKARKTARRTRNDDVRALVRFVKRRDPRVQARMRQVEEEKELQKQQMKADAAARKKEKKQAMEQWRQDAELQMAAAEEEDRLAGRVRLADLEDDYDYGGKKGKKGRKKKSKKKQPDTSSDEEKEQAAPSSDEGGADKDDGEARNGDGDGDGAAANGSMTNSDDGVTAATNNVIDADDDDNEVDPLATKVQAPTDICDSASESCSSSEEEEEPDEWRCECCRKDFKSSGQMENHLKSKKHKAAWKKYAAQLEEAALEEMMDDLDVNGE